jgi:hypothetical protein
LTEHTQLKLYPCSPKGEGGILFYLCPSVLPSVQDIFRHIFLSNCWWQKSDIWSYNYVSSLFKLKKLLVTHSWSCSITLHSSPMSQLKQLHTIWSCSKTDPAFKSCYKNITILNIHDWSVGKKYHQKINIKSCVFYFLSKKSIRVL